MGGLHRRVGCQVRPRNGRTGQLVQAGREGDGQAARRVHLAPDHVGNDLRPLLAGIPGLHNRADLVQPRHGHRSAGLQHDDGVGIGGGHGGDHGVLARGQGQVRHVGPFRLPAGGEDDHHVGPAGGGGGLGRIVPAVIADLHRSGGRLLEGHGGGPRLIDHPAEAAGLVLRIHGKGDGRSTDPQHLGRARAAQHPVIGIAAHHQHRLRLRCQGQEVPPVLQQHQPLGLGPAGDLRMGGEVDLRAPLRRMVDGPGGEQAPQDAAAHLRQAGGGDAPGGHLVRQLEEPGLLVDLLAALLVEAVDGVLHPVHRAPVGHDPARIAPVLLQHLVEQEVGAAGGLAVEEIVAAHDRTRLAALDGDLEGQQVGFPQARLVDHRIDRVPLGLLVIEGIVLDGGDHVLALGAADRLPVQGPGQQRILPQIFEVATVARLPRQVHPAAQQHVEALGPGLRPDHGPVGIGHFRVEAGRGSQSRRQEGGPLAPAQVRRIGDAEAGIGLVPFRQAQPGDGGIVARADQHVLGQLHVAAQGDGHGTVQPAHPLRIGHGRIGQPRALLRRTVGVEPGLVRRRRPLEGLRREQGGQHAHGGARRGSTGHGAFPAVVFSAG